MVLFDSRFRTINMITQSLLSEQGMHTDGDEPSDGERGGHEHQAEQHDKRHHSATPTRLSTRPRPERPGSMLPTLLYEYDQVVRCGCSLPVSFFYLSGFCLPGWIVSLPFNQKSVSCSLKTHLTHCN